MLGPVTLLLADDGQSTVGLPEGCCRCAAPLAGKGTGTSPGRAVTRLSTNVARRSR